MTLVRHTNEHNIARPSSPLAEAFARHGVRMTFHRNEEIFAQDDPVERLYRVARGVVRTSRVNADGRRQVGDFYYVGDVFGLEPGPLHRFGGEALEDCEIVVVRRSTVRAAELDQAILEAQRVEMERLQDHVVMLGRKSARERVASFLVSIAQRGAQEHADLPMGRQDMADYLGLTIETVSRMLTQLQGEAIVEFPTSRRFQIRKWTALEALAA
jgi:CRP/FNR family nitrogen fixation transcriptional regulator